ncbi:hypothetical protein ASE73_03050 [Sphingomonas sp. Leaf24]|uniref:hypothetical protein n=1 Tax=unclassified Sphingomonas TaxID=196159 RepID=UPI00070019C5|nr:MULTISPECIES: hypothetical protein [unclassified Sphingomonas]KQM23212.1 hypothetical protein ASE50_03050 [Sphingomonas sp. Leaf5]KQM96070.1 hypothetical protein ASE73_03050 [Sphingomonas sp. Leaf24]
MTIGTDRLLPARHIGPAADTSTAKEVIDLDDDTATVIIGVTILIVAFATLVLKFIEVARSK